MVETLFEPAKHLGGFGKPRWGARWVRSEEVRGHGTHFDPGFLPRRCFSKMHLWGGMRRRSKGDGRKTPTLYWHACSVGRVLCRPQHPHTSSEGEDAQQGSGVGVETDELGRTLAVRHTVQARAPRTTGGFDLERVSICADVKGEGVRGRRGRIDVHMVGV